MPAKMSNHPSLAVNTFPKEDKEDGEVWFRAPESGSFYGRILCSGLCTGLKIWARP